jgi:hypothetical protein
MQKDPDDRFLLLANHTLRNYAFSNLLTSSADPHTPGSLFRV